MATLSIQRHNSKENLKANSMTNMSIESDLNVKKSESDNGSSQVTISSTFTKITVQNVLSENNSNSLNISNNTFNASNAIIRKMKDFGMFGAVNNAAGNLRTVGTPTVTQSLIARKRPLSESKNNSENNKAATPVSKKAKPQKEQTTTTITPKGVKKQQKDAASLLKQAANANGGQPVKPAGTPGRKGLPLPQAVARRNARERNRVKQVNNGFAALRERIPEEVAEAFEVQNGVGRNNCKKLSKVETLRMAVEYIRSLERVLGFDFSVNGGDSGVGVDVAIHSCSSGDDSLIKDEFDALSPSLDEHYEDSLSNYDVDEYFAPINENNNSNININNNNNNNNNSMASLEYLENNNNNNNNNNNDNNLTNNNNDYYDNLNSLPDITTLNGLQYIRIPGTNTFRLLTPDLLVGSTHSPPNSSLDDDQFSSIIDTNYLSPDAKTTSSAQLQTNAIPLSPHSINNNNNNNNNDLTFNSPAAAPATPTNCYSQPLTIATTPTTTINIQANCNDINGKCLNNKTNTSPASSSPLSSSSTSPPSSLALSRSMPVPQSAAGPTLLTTATATITRTTPSPNAVRVIQQQHRLEQQQQRQQQSPGLSTLSPAANDGFLLQQTACATNTPNTDNATTEALHVNSLAQFVAPTLPHLLPPLRMLKQPYNITASPTFMSSSQPPLIYPQHLQQQQLLLGTLDLPMSPTPNDMCHTNALIATAQTINDSQSFYETEENNSFYETDNLSLKKEIDEVLLDASSANGSSGGLSDESIIERIGWWEAHTPKSDSNHSVIL